MNKCYVILESLYTKPWFIFGEDYKLKQLDNDRLLGIVAYATEEAAIEMVESLQKSAKEVTDENILHKLPNVDELAGRLRYYKVLEMENVIATYKVMAIDILKTTPFGK